MYQPEASASDVISTVAEDCALESSTQSIMLTSQDTFMCNQSLRCIVWLHGCSEL